MPSRLLPRLSFALGLTLVLAACSGQPESATDESSAAVAVSVGGVTVDVVVTNPWTGGFNGAVRIIDNAFPGPITTFQIVFKLGGSAAISGSGGTGPITGPDPSGNYTATCPDWVQFNPIQRGQSWDVGFTASGALSGSTIVSVKINGQTIPIPGDPTLSVVSLMSSTTTVTAADSITLTATATAGVIRVEFYDGAALLRTDTTPPYTQAVALTATSNGTHSYTARAFDAASTFWISAPVTVTVNIPPTSAVFRVDPQGRITRNGTIFPLRCGSWTGREGDYELATDPTNPRGAPMELYVGNTFWVNNNSGSGRTVAQDMAEMVSAGINMIRVPVVPQTLNASDPQEIGS